MENVKENKLGTQKIPSLLFSVSIPIIISMIVQAFYNIVDSIFVAQFNNDAGTFALTTAFPVQNLMIATAVGLAVGANALLSRALGEKNFEKVNIVAGQSFFLTLCGALLFLIIGIFFVKPFVSLQADAGTLYYDYSVDYISIVCIGAVGVFIQVTCERLLQATGKSLLSMIIQLSGAITNIILDPILIFGLLGAPQMGVAGAAIATVAGQLVAAVIGIFLNLAYNKEIKLIIKNFVPDFPVLREMLAIGIPAVLMQAIGSLMTFSMNAITGGFSKEATNVFGIYFKLQSFVFMPIFGLNNGMVPIVAYNYGAKRPPRVFEVVRIAAISAVSYMLLGLAVFQLFPETLLGMFNATEGMLKIGIPALRTISLSFLFAGISIISIATCQALGKSIYSLFVSIGRQIVVLIPTAYLLSLTGNVDYIWWAFPIAELVSLGLSLAFFFYVMKTFFGNKSGKNSEEMLADVD